jgi:hypothetical protein
VPVQPQLAGVSAGSVRGVRLVAGGLHPVSVGAGAPRLGRLPVPAGWQVAGFKALPAGLLVTLARLQLSDAPSARFYLVAHDGAAALLAAADQAVARWDGQAIFTLRWAPVRPDGSPSGRGVLSEISLSGRTLHRRQVPARFDLYADTAGGLLVGVFRTAQASADLQVVDPRTLAFRRHLGTAAYVVGATSTRAAWVTPAGCPSDCELVVADLPTGDRHTVTLARDYSPGQVAFSPDGHHLAIGYFGRHAQQAGGAAPGVVDVIDLASSHRQRLPGVDTAAKQAADLAWTPDGHWLAVAVGFTDKDSYRIGLWPTSGGPIHLLPGRYDGGSLSGSLLAL